MANSIPDVDLVGVWTNVYAATSIPVGTAISIQNKSSSPCLVFVSPTSPSVNSLDGYAMVQFETVNIDASETGCWVKGFGPIFVQLT